jgi:hypothetical protein
MIGRVMSALVLAGAIPAVAAAGPADQAVAPLAQPDITGSRAARSQLDLAHLDVFEFDGWLVLERLSLDWAFTRSWLLSAALPVAYGHESGATDPVITRSEVVLGNPSLVGRWRAVPLDGDSRLEIALSAGAVVPTAGEPDPLASDSYSKIRFNAEVFHRLHRPHEAAVTLALPVRADVRWTVGRTAAQAGVAVYTVVDSGDPELDVVQASAGVARRFGGGVWVGGDLHALASPPADRYRPDLEGGEDSHLDLGIEVGAGMPVGELEVAARIYLPQLPDLVSGQSLGVDLRYRID